MKEPVKHEGYVPYVTASLAAMACGFFTLFLGRALGTGFAFGYGLGLLAIALWLRWAR